MKNKKILFLLITVLVIILFFIFFIVKRFNSNDTENILEYIPEEEISESQLRETIVTLFFLDKNSNTIKSEGRLIDSVVLLQNPYKELVNLLISGLYYKLYLSINCIFFLWLFNDSWYGLKK